MLHTSKKVQKPRVFCWCKSFVGALGGVRWKKLYEHFWKLGKFILNISSSLDITCHNCMGKTTQCKIKILENTHTKYWRFRIEAVTKMEDYSTICQRTLKMLRYLLLFFRGLAVLLWTRNAFPQLVQKMVVHVLLGVKVWNLVYD